MSDQEQALERQRRSGREVNEAMEGVAVDQLARIDGDELRAQLASPAEHVCEALGARPSAIGERDRWTQAAAQLIHGDELSPDHPVGAPTMDYDSGLEP